MKGKIEIETSVENRLCSYRIRHSPSPPHPPTNLLAKSANPTPNYIYSLNSLSTPSNPSKKLWKAKTPNPGSLLPVVALILCILNCGIPQSIALIPVCALNMGPTVPPLLLSFLIWKTWSFGSCVRVPTSRSTHRWKMAVDTASVVMWAFESAETAGPTLRRGEWFSR